MFASDPQGALATAAAGLALGQEMANLENNRQKRELEKARIEFLKKKNDYELKELDFTATNLPTVMGAKLAEAQAQRAAQENLLAQQQALALANVPAIAGATAGVAAQGALMGATAALPEAGLSPSQKAERAAQAAAVGTAKGNLLIGPGALAGETAFADGPSQPEISPDQLKAIQTNLLFQKQGFKSDTIKGTNAAGDTVDQDVVRDAQGNIIRYLGEPRITHLGSAKQLAVKAQERVPAVKTLLGQVGELESAIDAFEKATPSRMDRFGKAFSTRAASVEDSGLLRIGVKTAGQFFQDPSTVEIAAKIAALKNQLTKEQSGGTVTAQEFANLDPEIPSYWDLVDPNRARAKLKAFRAKADSVLKTAAQFSEASKAGGAPTATAAQPSAPTASGLLTPQDLGKKQAPQGTRVQTTAGTYESRLVNGRLSWVRVGQ